MTATEVIATIAPILGFDYKNLDLEKTIQIPVLCQGKTRLLSVTEQGSDLLLKMKVLELPIDLAEPIVQDHLISVLQEVTAKLESINESLSIDDSSSVGTTLHLHRLLPLSNVNHVNQATNLFVEFLNTFDFICKLLPLQTDRSYSHSSNKNLLL